MQVEIKVPVLPESVTEGTLGDWHKQVGDSVAADENIVDLETDKVVLEIVASSAGVIESIAFDSGATVKAEEVLGVINTDGAAAAPEQAAAPGQEQDEEADGSGKAGPAARKLLAEHGLNIDDVKGSGKKGAVTKADVERHLKQQPAATAQAPVAKTEAPAAEPAEER